MENYIFIRISKTAHIQQIIDEYTDFMSKTQEQYLPSDMGINDVFREIDQTPNNIHAWNMAKENYMRVFGDNPPNNIMELSSYTS